MLLGLLACLALGFDRARDLDELDLLWPELREWGPRPPLVVLADDVARCCCCCCAKGAILLTISGVKDQPCHGVEDGDPFSTRAGLF